MEGWIKLERKILTHWIFKDSEKLKAWMIILMSVNHTDKKVLIGNKLMLCNRGESLQSLDSWAKLFGSKWNKSKVRRFFKLLENDSMIVLKNETQTTRLTVCKYDDYQSNRNESETQMKRKRNANETQTTPNKNVKNEKKINNAREKELDDFMKMEKPKRVFDQIMFECPSFAKIEKPFLYEHFCQKCLVAKDQVGQQEAINEVSLIIRQIENYILKSGKEYKIALSVFNTFTQKRWSK